MEGSLSNLREVASLDFENGQGRRLANPSQYLLNSAYVSVVQTGGCLGSGSRYCRAWRHTRPVVLASVPHEQTKEVVSAGCVEGETARVVGLSRFHTLVAIFTMAPEREFRDATVVLLILVLMHVGDVAASFIAIFVTAPECEL